MNFLFGALFLYTAWYFSRHYKKPAEASRSDIKTMAIIITLYSGLYGGHKIWVALGGTPFGGF